MEKKYYLFKMNSSTIYGFTILLYALAAGGFYLIYGNNSLNVLKEYSELAIILLIPYLLLHEGLHALSYVIHGADFKNITFGGHMEKGVLCCLCKQNITKKNILFSLVYPLFFIGIVTLIIGVLLNWPLLVILSLANIGGCSGDLVMFYHLSRIRSFEFSEYNDPVSFGLYSDEDLSKKRMLGLTFVETKQELKRDDLRKFDVSKTTIIIFIFFFVAAIITILGKLG